MLEHTSLAALFATFDRRLQTLLSAPNVISSLALEHHQNIKTGTLLYLIGSIRDVGHLKLGTRLRLDPATFARFPALNPTELVLGEASLDQSCLKVAYSAVATSTAPAETSFGAFEPSFWSPSEIPNFALLTPRLTTLTLESNLGTIFDSRFGLIRGKTETEILYSPDKFDELSFPATLTSFSYRPRFVSESENRARPLLLRRLPETLRSLRVKCSSVDEHELIVIISQRFKQLNTLKISSYFPSNRLLDVLPPPLDGVQLPSSLQHLWLHSCSFCPLGAYNLGVRDMKDLISFSVKGCGPAQNEVISGFQDLPSSLSSLRVALQRGSKSGGGVQITSFPLHLTKLSLTPHKPLNCSLVEQLPTLTKLTTLELRDDERGEISLLGPGELPPNSNFGGCVVPVNCIPPSVTHLIYTNGGGQRLSEHGIGALPAGLLFLEVNAFMPSLRDTLTQRAPKCAVFAI